MFKWLRERRMREMREVQQQIRDEEKAEEARLTEELRLEEEERVAMEEAAEEKRREEALEKAKNNPEGKESKEPWVTIVGDAVGEEGLQLSLDWNDAFIEFLKAGGLEGKDDTQIVQLWLTMIAKQQADRLGEERLELEGKTSEFE